LTEPPGTCSWPTVPTSDTPCPQRRSTSSTISAAAAAASRRIVIGVVPAWLATPVSSTR
jgi:hypothetical protein